MSFIINGSNTVRYFKLQKGSGQGDRVFAYLLILYLENVSILIKAKKRVKRIITFKHTRKYEITGIGIPKNAKADVSGMACIDLCSDSIKITGLDFSYNNEKRNEKLFLENMTKIQNVKKKLKRIQKTFFVDF